MKPNQFTYHPFFLTLWAMFGLFVLSSCNKKDDKPYKPQIVVDARIEEGGFPYVFLSQSTQYESVIDSSSYFQIVLTKAKITVWTDDECEILILFRDTNYFPMHFYRGNSLKGKAGKTYHLQIIVDGDTLTSETTIPHKVMLDTFRMVTDESDRKKGLIWVGFSDPVNEANYYRAFTRIFRKQYQYQATHLSVVDDKSFNGKYIEFPLYQGNLTNTEKKTDFRFFKSDTIDVKFCTMDKASYDFWSSYEREVVNSGNPFGAEGQNLRSNISGGIGVWSGYGVYKFRINGVK